MLFLGLAQPWPAMGCIGDCEARGVVTVSDILKGVAIALGEAPASACTRMDADGDGGVTIDEILVALTNGLEGCPLEIDQAWQGPVGECDKPSIDYQIQAAQPIAQEFVPTMPLLAGIEVFLGQVNQPFTDTVTASVYEGSLEGELLGTATAFVPVRQSQTFWQSLTFPAPLRLEPGALYVLRLEARNATHVWRSDEGTFPCDPATYEAGRSIVFGRFREVDFYFRSLAVAEPFAPEP